MFKRIQKYLLINQPLLWNTKVVPVGCFLILAHIIFYGVGYQFGQMDFSETSRHFRSKDNDIMFFFSVVIAILAIILWLVFYFKNNALKSFYPKTNWSLFKEWSIIFIISVLLCTLQFSYLNGYDCRVRSYYSEEETKKRCEIINKASLFYGTNYDAPIKIDSVINDTAQLVIADYVKFNGKKYSLESLINKDSKNFSFYDAKHDSLTKRKVKLWLIEGKTDSIKGILQDYFKLVREHKLVSNVNEAKWFSMVYNPPTFIQKKIVAKRESDLYGNYDYDYTQEVYAKPAVEDEQKLDTLNEYIKVINNVEFRYNKNYVPADELEFSYQKIADAYVDPSVDSEAVLVSLYFAVCLSILIFSFRVTSGRNWLITLISLGVINIILGIFSAIFNYFDFLYIGGLLLLFLVLSIYFVIKLTRKSTKGISAIVLNGVMWLLPAFIPLCYALTSTILSIAYANENLKYDYDHPNLRWLRDNVESMAWWNLLFVLLIMVILSVKIKKWKGIAES